MKLFKGFWTNFKRPPAWVQVIVFASTLTVLSLALFSILYGYGKSTFAIGLYVVFAGLFFYCAYLTYIGFKYMRNKMLIVADKYTFTRNLHQDYAFRTIVFSAWSLFCNFGYAVWLGVTAITLHSLWYTALACCYVFLSTTRGWLLVKSRRDEQKYKNDFIKLRRANVISYVICGGMLIGLTLLLGATVILTIVDGNVFRYAKTILFATAGFALYRVGMSVMGLFRAKKYEDEIIHSVKNTNLVTALVSVLALLSSILDAFAVADNRVIWLAVTGTVACIGIILLGLSMVLRGARTLQKLAVAQAQENAVRKL